MGRHLAASARTAALLAAAVRPEASASEDPAEACLGCLGADDGVQRAEIDSRGVSSFASAAIGTEAAEEDETYLSDLRALGEHIDELGEVSDETLRDDLHVLYSTQGNLSAMSGTGQKVVEVLERSHRLLSTLSAEEADLVVGLMTRQIAESLRRKPSEEKLPDSEEGAPMEIEQKPSGMASKVFYFYQKMMAIYKKFAGTRRNINAVASFVATLNPSMVKDSVLLKIIFILYSDPGEDDYPYVPRKCAGIDTFLESMMNGASRTGGFSHQLLALHCGYPSVDDLPDEHEQQLASTPNLMLS
eukprot:CAMPEP_0178420026 /NCGR_PEP_ID=MMETSP0689_2-20121128/25917_1 /TAXON_ID=160604 /ORGANISM="Amphidinium massartii, Strain CS-259" /LENGTH=301 /DNA_ID=CAMNT_0020041489 /DNA_START=118 /DNA_END=1019 /DNA_ORIENTATION=-